MRVKFSPEAAQDLEDVWFYIASEYDDIEAAEKIFVKIQDFCLNIVSKNPEIGTIRPDLQKGIRFFPISPYLIFYSISSDTIEIQRIYHEKRDYQKFF